MGCTVRDAALIDAEPGFGKATCRSLRKPDRAETTGCCLFASAQNKGVQQANVGFLVGFLFVFKEHLKMSLGTILLIVLILILVGIIPSWPHSRSWGYAPSGVIGIVVLVLLILVLTGRM